MLRVFANINSGRRQTRPSALKMDQSQNAENAREPMSLALSVAPEHGRHVASFRLNHSLPASLGRSSRPAGRIRFSNCDQSSLIVPRKQGCNPSQCPWRILALDAESIPTGNHGRLPSPAIPPSRRTLPHRPRPARSPHVAQRISPTARPPNKTLTMSPRYCQGNTCS